MNSNGRIVAVTNFSKVTSKRIQKERNNPKSPRITLPDSSRSHMRLVAGAGCVTLQPAFADGSLQMTHHTYGSSLTNPRASYCSVSSWKFFSVMANRIYTTDARTKSCEEGKYNLKLVAPRRAAPHLAFLLALRNFRIPSRFEYRLSNYLRIETETRN